MDVKPPTPKELARSQLPNFPEEIFTLWMDKFINLSGWPPKKLENDLPKDSWEKLLLGRSLDFWRNRKWEKRIVSIDSYTFPKIDWECVSQIIGANTLGLDNEIKRQIYNTKARFDRILPYVKTNLKLPEPPIFLELSDGKYEIMDGHHRLAVFFYLFTQTELKKKLEPVCEAWIAI